MDPTGGGSGNGNENLLESTTPYTDFVGGYMDKALDYEHSKPEVAVLRNVRNTKNMSLDEKYELLLNLKETINNNTRQANLYQEQDDKFYSNLIISATQEVDTVIMISEEPITETRTSENPELTQNVYGNSYNKFQILEMAEDYMNPKNATRGIKETSTKKWKNTIRYRYKSDVDQTMKDNMRKGYG